MNGPHDRTAHGPEVEHRIGDGLRADDDVRLGYPSGRIAPAPLQLGPGAQVRSGTVLYGGSVIGARFTTGHHVVVREQCRIGDDVAVWSGSVVDYGCEIGDGVKIHTNCYVAQFSVIEDDAFLAPGVSFANDLYPGDESSLEAMTGPHIGRGAQLGVNVTVLPFVRIGAGALIGSGAVVTRDIPAGMVAMGCPAVPIRRTDELVPVERRLSRHDGRFRLTR